jgi:hypothetical protein
MGSWPFVALAAAGLFLEGHICSWKCAHLPNQTGQVPALHVAYLGAIKESDLVPDVPKIWGGGEAEG